MVYQFFGRPERECVSLGLQAESFNCQMKILQHIRSSLVKCIAALFEGLTVINLKSVQGGNKN